MNNPINYAIQRIKNSVNKEILAIGLMEDNLGYNTAVSLDEKILFKIIKGYLLLDLNILSTISKKIDLSSCSVTYYQNPNKEYEYIIEIPDEVTDGKEVVSASFVLYNNVLPAMGMIAGDAMSNGLNSIMQAHSTLNTLVVNRLDVIGRNIVLVNTGNLNWTFMNSVMEVSLAPNPNMSHVKKSAIIYFGDLAVLAAKAWLHNELFIQVDQGYIKGGHSIDSIKSRIDDYSSAENDYKEKRDGWEKIALMLDTSFYAKFIEMQLP